MATVLGAAPLLAHASDMPDYPRVMLRSLDKITARTMSFDARVGSTIKFGPLFIKIRACRKADPIEQPESAAFLQIWEVGADQKAKWVFSGWMFASSPALSAMDHPVYDVWVIDCLEDEQPEPAADLLEEAEAARIAAEEAEAAAQAELPPGE